MIQSELPHFERQMSDAEGLMWRMEKDPYLSSTFANVSILDRRPDMERFLRRMERAVTAVPRLRQRVQAAPVNLSAPLWVDDPDFDLHHHVRHVALPRPGSMRQLLDLATIIAADPFDRSRPLWQFWVVDGLRGGKAALVQKIHHTITDGEGGVALSMQFLDLERDAPEPPPLPPWEVEAAPTAEPNGAEVVRDLMTGGLRLPIALLRQVRDLLADPAHLPESGAALAESLRSVVGQLSDVDPARSPLWTRRSLRRHLETMRAPFHETRAVARRLGGTLNVAFITVAAEAAGRYHDSLGEPVESLRASMAVSTRKEGSGANAFGLVRMLVPTGAMPIAERFAAICEATRAATAGSNTATLERLASLAASLPTSLVTRLARTQSQTVDFATSNVRGAPVPVFVAGAQLLENYPIGPLGGVAFNLTLLSYLGSLDMGLNIDTAAVEEPELLRRCLERAVKDLLKA
jgi:WS/DGAT/MGAT family acyltransferase